MSEDLRLPIKRQLRVKQKLRENILSNPAVVVNMATFGLELNQKKGARDLSLLMR